MEITWEGYPPCHAKGPQATLQEVTGAATGCLASVKLIMPTSPPPRIPSWLAEPANARRTAARPPSGALLSERSRKRRRNTCRDGPLPKSSLPHHVLGLEPTASKQEIFEAFKERAMRTCLAGGSDQHSGLQRVAAAFEALIGRQLGCQAGWSGSAAARAPKTATTHAPRTATERLTSPKQGKGSASRKQDFMDRLHGLLSQLEPRRRRAVIALQLTQTQRLALEHWMVDQKMHAAAETPKPTWHGTASGGCSLHGRFGGSGYTVAACLERNLWVQSGRCRDLNSAIEALGTLLLFRAMCRACPEEPFEDRVIRAAERLQSQWGSSEAPRVFLGARISFARGLTFATPLHSHVVSALRDWRRLLDARGEALVHGAQLLPGYSPEVAEAQWSRTCRVWAEMWAERGRPRGALRARLAAKEAARRPLRARLARLWEQRQERAARQLARLLAAQARRKGRVAKSHLVRKGQAQPSASGAALLRPEDGHDVQAVS